MPSNNSHAAKHVFFYLISFFALGFTATAIGQVVFQLINHLIPETTSSYYGDYQNSVLRFAVSSLIVAAPVYYFSVRQINRELASGGLASHSSIRKWLTYIALFIAAAVAIGDLIFVLNSFLSGEMTLKFLLKSLTIFAIAGGFGAYYFFDLKREDLKRDSTVKAFGVVFILIVLACLTVAFSLIDSPFKAREIREDRERVDEIRNITAEIENFYRENGQLPTDLSQLVDDFKLTEKEIQDPKTKEIYVYNVSDDTNYELCSNFALASEEDQDRVRWEEPEWSHLAGEQCFSISISSGDVDRPYSEVKPVR